MEFYAAYVATQIPQPNIGDFFWWGRSIQKPFFQAKKNPSSHYDIQEINFESQFVVIWYTLRSPEKKTCESAILN